MTFQQLLALARELTECSWSLSLAGSMGSCRKLGTTPGPRVASKTLWRLIACTPLSDSGFGT